MRYRQLFICMVFVSFPVPIAAQTKEPLKLVATIPLPGLKDGDFDHFAPDIDGHRLFLADEENDKVDVLDTATNTRIHTIEDAKAPHAILYRKDLKKLFVVEGDASAVKIYDSDTYKALGEIGYHGTATVELDGGDAAFLREVNRRFELILSGA